jgi:hypothetical protein
MQNYIFDLIKQNKISDGESLILFYLFNFGSQTEEALAQALGRSLKSVKRYLATLSSLNLITWTNLSTVSLLAFNNFDKDNKKDLLLTRETVLDVLKKYQLEALIDSVWKRTPPDSFTPEALEYIISYCLNKKQQKLIKKTFTVYFLTCLEKMWGEALIETALKIAEPAEIDPIIYEIQEGDIEVQKTRPEPNPVASKIWDKLRSTVSAPIAVIKLWFDQVVPVNHDDGKLYLYAENPFAIDKIKSYIDYPIFGADLLTIS